jgi:hypothetical protein
MRAVTHSPIENEAVAARFASYPPAVRKKLLALRELVLRTAKSLPEVGEIEETLKWSEPAYVTRSGAGSTVRMDWKARAPQQVAMYFNCQTNLVESFRTMFPNDFRFEGNRALVFGLDERVPLDALAVCVRASLTYHLAKVPKAGRAAGMRRGAGASR